MWQLSSRGGGGRPFLPGPKKNFFAASLPLTTIVLNDILGASEITANL